MQVIKLVTLLTLFVSSCVGLGYLAASWVKRGNYSNWATGGLITIIASFWPMITLKYIHYTAQEYVRQHPHEVNDGPAMVWVSMLFVGAPTLFIVSLFLALLGVAILKRAKNNIQSDSG